MYYVSVDGQLDMPFPTLKEATDFALYMSKEGFDTFMYSKKD